MTREVRVRFAPSPTGPLHIGGVRTALYNYLFARQRGGKMILRIEDTDSQRFVPGAEEYILESLKWCGITIDEGVGVGGPHAPYRQSERRDIFLKYALELVEAGWAYYAFDTAEELDALRKDYEAQGKTFAYNYQVRTELATSLSLSKEQVEERIARGDVWVIRFKMPENEVVKMHDLIRGDVEVNTSTLDDKVLYKSVDALPTYHLANIVDDHLMEISHVIRGEEWLPSLPLHYLLYRAFGWSDVQPEFAHLHYCSNLRVEVSSRSAMVIRWDFRYSLSFGSHPQQVRPHMAIVRMDTSPRPLSICWHFWGGIPVRSRSYSRWRSFSRASRSIEYQRQERVSNPIRRSGSMLNICTVKLKRSSLKSISPYSKSMV